MAKKKSKSKAKQNGRNTMTAAKVEEVESWLEHMRRHLERAIWLSKRMNGSKLDESDDLYWALVKYAENVQECIIQLDSINSTILPVLDEIPLEASQRHEFSWQGLKGMRQRLAHDFRRIDPEILWRTVTYDFPILMSLISRVIVAGADTQEGKFMITIKAQAFQSLPVFEEREGFKPGNSFISLSFDVRGRTRCVRFVRSNDGTIMFEPGEGVTVTKTNAILVDEDDEEKLLGRWPIRGMQAEA